MNQTRNQWLLYLFAGVAFALLAPYSGCNLLTMAPVKDDQDFERSPADLIPSEPSGGYEDQSNDSFSAIDDLLQKQN